MMLAKKLLRLLFALILCFQCVACAGEPKTVEPEITAIYLSQNSIEMEMDESYQMQYTILPETVTGYTLSWKSTDDSVATVDSMGLIKAVAPGTTRVICSTPDGITDVCEVTVKEPSAIEQLNEDEKDLFERISADSLTLFNNDPSSVRIGGLYYSDEDAKERFSSSKSMLVRIEGANRSGGVDTIWVLLWSSKTGGLVGAHAWTSSQFNKSALTIYSPIPIEETVMNVAKVNAALEEYWETQHR